MKIIIAGSRDITNFNIILDAVKKSRADQKITELVCGEARGVDSLGKRWAKSQNIPVISFPANWDKYGKSAGYRRNEEMAEYAAPDGGLLAIWQNRSRGTGHMIDIANQYGLRIYVYKL